MSAEPYNEPAFPTHPAPNGDVYSGMSLRDWFAGQALAGLLACPSTRGEENEFARTAYSIADAMLRARSAP